MPPLALVLWISDAGILVGLALLAWAGVLRHRRVQREREQAEWTARETGIEIEVVGGPLPYGERRESVWRVTLTNVSTRPRVAILEMRGVPDGWRAATSLPRLPLSAGERVTVSVHVAPDLSVPAEAVARITVAARPEEARERVSSVALECVAPDHSDARTRRTVVLREGPSARARLRP